MGFDEFMRSENDRDDIDNDDGDEIERGSATQLK